MNIGNDFKNLKNKNVKAVMDVTVCSCFFVSGKEQEW